MCDVCIVGLIYVFLFLTLVYILYVSIVYNLDSFINTWIKWFGIVQISMWNNIKNNVFLIIVLLIPCLIRIFMSDQSHIRFIFGQKNHDL